MSEFTLTPAVQKALQKNGVLKENIYAPYFLASRQDGDNTLDACFFVNLRGYIPATEEQKAKNLGGDRLVMKIYPKDNEQDAKHARVCYFISKDTGKKEDGKRVSDELEQVSPTQFRQILETIQYPNYDVV